MFRVRVMNLHEEGISDCVEIDYEAEDGIEVLIAQIKCMDSQIIESELKLLDYAGREVTNNMELEDISENETSSSTRRSCIWILNMESLVALDKDCTLSVSDESLMQSSQYFIDTPYSLCTPCSRLFSDVLVRSDNSILRCFRCDGDKLADMGIMCIKKDSSLSKREDPITVYLKRHLMDAAISEQAQKVIHNHDRKTLENNFLARISSGCKTVQVYEDAMQQYSARNTIKYDLIHKYATDHLVEYPSSAEDEAFLRGLLRWFKNDFFKWTNQPACSNASCASGTEHMDSRGTRPPSSAEQQFGWAGRTEVYQCRSCSTVTDFPRYNNPSCLLSTKQGRCGEWANAFCLICRSLSLDARYVLDFTDHVWVEVWLPSQNRFVHLDSCEQAFDNPLLYEAGWGKKLTYIVSFSRYGVIDATPRYTRTLGEVIARRSAENVSEEFLIRSIAGKDKDVESIFKRGRHSQSTQIDGAVPMLLSNLLQGKSFYDNLFLAEVSEEIMVERKRLMRRELEGMRCLERGDVQLGELRGRLSGSIAWRIARGEIGKEKV